MSENITVNLEDSRLINSEDSRIINLEDIKTLEIGFKSTNVDIPSDEIINIMLSDYIKFNDKDLKIQLEEILNVYRKHFLKGSSYQDTLYIIARAIPIKAIITPKEPPNYKAAVKSINDLILDSYIQFTRKDAPIERLKDFIGMTVESIALNLFKVYNIETYNDYVAKVGNVTYMRANFVNQYRNAITKEDKLQVQIEATEWENKEDRDNFVTEYIVNTLKQYNTKKGIDYIFNKLVKALNTSDIEKLDSIIPTSYIMANNKMMNKLSNGELKEGLTDLLVIDRPRKEVVTPISLNYDDENIKIANKDKRFTPYDRTVHNSICSIFEAGNATFTPDQVYRCMNGLTNTEKVSSQAIGAVTKSIDKTRRMYTRIEVEKEAKEYGLDKITMEDHILSARKITLEAGGREVVGYKFNYSNNSKPIIYEYAQITGQVLTIPSKLLNTKDVIRSTTEVTIIREYLIRRIEVMKRKGNKHQSNKIRFTSIYKEIGQDDPIKQKAQRVRENIDKLLSSFKDNNYIKDYKFYKEGRSFKGIEIFY